MRFMLLAALGLALAACDSGSGTGEGAPSASHSLAGLVRDHAGSEAPDVRFIDDEGTEIGIDDFVGEPVLVNLWASWCAPCVEELPTLLALSQREGAPHVLAVSQDMGPQSSVRAFLEEHEVAGLGAVQDAEMGLTDALEIRIMPTTILYDADGREVWRYVGDLDWTSDEAAEMLAEAF